LLARNATDFTRAGCFLPADLLIARSVATSAPIRRYETCYMCVSGHE
jgi:hypothetical protein